MRYIKKFFSLLMVLIIIASIQILNVSAEGFAGTYIQGDFCFGYVYPGPSGGLLDMYLKEYKGTEQTVTIPSYVINEKLSTITASRIIGIWKEAFKENKSINCVNIPNTVDFIESQAFYGCSNLRTVSANYVEHIGTEAFYGCTSLTEVTLASTKELQLNAFGRCTGLEKLTYNNNITSGTISNAFSGCTNLKEIVIGEGVSEIPDSMFENMLYITNIEISDNVRIIGKNAFSGCTSLKELSIPDDVYELGKSAFSGCVLLKKVNIPYFVTRIESGTFAGCKNLEEIVISENTIFIDQNAFDAETSVTIVCKKNSYADEYAKEHDINTRYYTSNIYEDGSYLYPYLISDESELSSIRNDMNAHYKLVSNIALTKAWTPIGTSTMDYFVGSLDGNGYDISNLNSQGSYAGLFGCNAGVIKNLTVYVGQISATEYAGGICGYNLGCIDNCNVYGNTIFSTEYAGGICGYHSNNSSGWLVSLSNCYSEIDEVSGYYAGGIVGYNQFENIERCSTNSKVSGSYSGGLIGFNVGNVYESCAFGTVSGTISGGGLIGYQSGKDLSVSNCYSSGIIQGNVNNGGLIGYIMATCNISNCYSMGRVKAWASSEEKYNLVGVDAGDATYENCYYLYYGKLSNNRGSGIPISNLALQYQTTYKNWGFGSIWKMSANDYAHPVLLNVRTQNTMPIKFFGDINGDQVIDASDYSHLNNYIFDNTLEIDLSSSDVVPDDIINRKDLLRLAKYFAGQDVILGIEDDTDQETHKKNFVYITLCDKEFTYDGAEKTIAITGTLPTGVNAKVVYENEKATNVGEYNVKAIVTADGYNTLILNAKMAIKPKTVQVTSIDMNGKTAVLTGVLEKDRTVTLDFDQLNIDNEEIIDITTSTVKVSNFVLAGENATNYIVATEFLESRILKDNSITINVTANNGTVTGGGKLIKNSDILLSATANEGYKFMGWYINDILISSNNPYIFKGATDIVITAKFELENSGGDSGGSSGGSPGGSSGGSLGGSLGGGSTDTTSETANNTDVKDEKPENIKLTYANVFTDVKEIDWYYEAIQFAYEKGITSGVSETEFAPNQKVTRGQFITMLFRAYNINEMTGDNFSDCGNTWYTGYLAAAKQLGISNGIGNNKFDPEREITREEMVTLLFNYLKYSGEVDDESTNSIFADNEAISDWAKAGVAYVSTRGYVNGKGNNIFAPKDNATRAELVQIFFNMLK